MCAPGRIQNLCWFPEVREAATETKPMAGTLRLFCFKPQALPAATRDVEADKQSCRRDVPKVRNVAVGPLNFCNAHLNG